MSSVRIYLEFGHEASIRTKRTPEGFTHDWEVFVRGFENAPVENYIEKVVFNLHQTFAKPKRVIREPPYSVKESGYAGFPLAIDIYLRSKDETPKKLHFVYDLSLQTSGAPIFKVQKEEFVINNPSDEFKSKLLRGGGIVVNFQEPIRDNRTSGEEKSQQLVSKPRLGGSDYGAKKHKSKADDSRTSNSFQDVFGTPIAESSKSSVEPKVVAKDKNSNVNKLSSAEKDKSKSKHSPHKDKERSRDKSEIEKKSKEEKKRDEKKDHSKDREEITKDKKEKRDKGSKAESPSPSAKRSSSPKISSSSPLPKYKDDRKSDVAKAKRSLDDKSEKKLKKEKKDRERKESKHKDRDSQKSGDVKENKVSSRDKEAPSKEVEQTPSPQKVKKEKSSRDRDSSRDLKEVEHAEHKDKMKYDKFEDKPKHKHKKKDKDKRDKDKSIDREKSHKIDKKSGVEKGGMTSGLKYVEGSKDVQRDSDRSSLFNSPKSLVDSSKSSSDETEKPLDTLLDEYVDSDSSNSSSSTPDSFTESTLKPEPKQELFDVAPIEMESETHEIKPEPQVESETVKTKSKREKTKKREKKAERELEKNRKHNRLEDKSDDEPTEKRFKGDYGKDSDNETKKQKRKLEDKSDEDCSVKQFKGEYGNSRDSDESNSPPRPTENEENCDDYMTLLRTLQAKIVSIKDGSELGKVVALIAQTGQFELSSQTFDFDLCNLHPETIKQLHKLLDDIA